MSKDPISLRGHHLLCMLSYIGKGYTAEFVSNFNEVTEQLNKGASITLVEGPDVICASMHDGNGPTCQSGEHCLLARTLDRDKTALQAVSIALDTPLEIGSKLTLDQTKMIKLRQLFANGQLRIACTGCEWFDLCTTIANDGFKKVKLMPSRE
jgi:uncharacterized protein